jgi:predicted Zn finger-like uncharacterized protein
MLITCPSCASRYEIDAAKIGPAGRKVRCAGCGTRWLVPAEAALPEEPDPLAADAFPEAPDAAQTAAALEDELRRAALAAELADPQTPEPVAATAPPARTRRARPKGSPLALRLPSFAALRRPPLLAAAILIVLGLAAWQRVALVRSTPALAGLFETLGLPVNARGLKISGIEAELVEDGQGRFLVVRGDVTNLARGANAVPQLALSVKDSGGRTLYRWTAETPRKELAPAELVHFRARLSAPPDAGASVEVRFVADAA